jgi:hypothetical protein
VPNAAPENPVPDLADGTLAERLIELNTPAGRLNLLAERLASASDPVGCEKERVSCT